MIAIRINKLFSRLGRGFHYSFAGLPNSEETESSKRMRLSCEMAVWSCKVIKTIIDAKPDNNRDIEQPSLREQIINLSIQGFKYSQESKNAVLKIFMEGIPLNQQVWNQTRITYGKQGASDILQKRKDLPFIFCPNMLVTRVMFRILMTRDFNLMTLGEYGISKTISIMLLHILSSIVNQYKYSAFSDSQEKIYYQELMRKGLIFDVPKFFYWNIRKDMTKHKNIQQYVKDIILQQATQISKEEKEQLMKNSPNLNRLAYNLKKLYKNKQITTRVVIDQLNILASLMRKWNIFCAQSKKQEKQYKRDLLKLEEDLEKEIEKNKKQQLTQELKKEKKKFDSWKISNDQKRSTKKKKLKNPAQKLLQLMRSYQNVANLSIYNSSINIEKQLLKKYKGFSVNNLSLQLEQEGELWFQQIRFNENIREKWGRNDFYHYFWFEIQKRLSAKQFSLQRLERLKSVFYHKVKDTNIPGYYRFLNIRELFEQKASLLNFTKEFTDEQMSDKIGQIIYALKLYSLDCCRQKIERFVEKLQQDQKQMKRNYTIMLHKMAVRQIQQENGDKYMTTTLDEIDDKYLGAGRGKARKFINSNAYDKEFIQPIISSNNQSVTFPWTANEYLEINQIDIVKQKISLTGLEALQYHIKDDIGKAFEFWLIKVLQQPQTVVKFVVYIQESKTFVSRYIININGQSTYLSFEGDALNFNINFSQLIKLARQRPGQYFLGLPFKLTHPIIQCIQEHEEQEKTNLQQVDENNPTTYFIIFSCKEQKQKPLHFFIESFDAMVTLEEDTLEEKTEKAKQLFVKMIENPTNKSQFTEAEKERYFDKEIEDNLQFTVTHTILYRKELAKNRKTIIVQLKNKQTLTINFVAIEDIQIQYCRETSALQLFQAVKTIALRFCKQDYADSKSAQI